MYRESERASVHVKGGMVSGEARKEGGGTTAAPAIEANPSIGAHMKHVKPAVHAASSKAGV